MKGHSVARRSPPLGLRELIAIGIGGMIGGGIFSVIGLAVEIAKTAAPMAFALGGIVAFFAGYAYARLALAYPSEGASFTYLSRAFPNRPWIATITGWSVIVGYIGTLALYAFTFGAYGADLLGAPENVWLRHLLSIGVLVLFAVLNLKGARLSGYTEDILVYGKLLLLLLLGLVGLASIQPQRLQTVPSQAPGSILMAGALIFVAYEGFQLITNAVLEAKNPKRNVPAGIYLSIAMVVLVYVLVSVVAIGALSLSDIVQAEEYALAVVARPVLGNWGRWLVDIAALLATSSAINATVFGASRMMADMAEADQMPAVFARRNARKVPWAAVLVLTALGLAFTLLGRLTLIASFSSLIFLVVSMAVGVANWRLRKRTKAHPIIAIAGLLLMGAAIAMLLHYLWLHDRQALMGIAGIEASVAFLLFLFWLRKKLRL